MGNGSKRGHLVLIGGAEDKQNERLILKETVRLNSAQNVAVVTTATSYPDEVYETYLEAFHDIGVPRVAHFDIGRRSDANDSKRYKGLSDCKLLYFTGGNQERLVDIIGNTRLHRKIQKLHLKGVTIAGTSAGAAAIGNPMILGGDGNAGLQKGYVTILDGLGLLDRIVIDTHFLARCRIPRLVQVLSTGKADFGIGVCEDTAVLLSPDRVLTVVGSGTVTCLNSRVMDFSNYDRIRYDDKIAVDGLRLSMLTHGARFDLNAAAVVDAVEGPRFRNGSRAPLSP